MSEIHSRLAGLRERGGAVLLISEDLDELLEMADRILVMSEGRAVFETDAAHARREARDCLSLRPAREDGYRGRALPNGRGTNFAARSL